MEELTRKKLDKQLLEEFDDYGIDGVPSMNDNGEPIVTFENGMGGAIPEILIGVKSNKLLFGQYKSKWGSCNSKKTISYDWRIIMAPFEVIHYLIIHELCHIKYPNHSKHFWKYVEKYMINYKIQKKWLKNNSNKLIF